MSTPSYNEIHQQVQRRYRRRSLFIFHIIIATICLMVLWFTASPRSTLPETFSMLWIGLLLIHGVRVFMGERSEKAIERTWRRYYGDLPYADEKPKRTLRLTDDAELEVVEEDMQERKALRRE
jgi:hypothetical protein